MNHDYYSYFFIQCMYVTYNSKSYTVHDTVYYHSDVDHSFVRPTVFIGPRLSLPLPFGRPGIFESKVYRIVVDAHAVGSKMLGKFFMHSPTLHKTAQAKFGCFFHHIHSKHVVEFGRCSNSANAIHILLF
jgi:hypothetical protein